MILKGSRILITGGNSGIGAAATRILTEAGARVAITGRDGAKLEKIAAETGALAIPADVSSEADIEKTFKVLLAEFGGLDALINNAGVTTGSQRVNEISIENFRKVFGINVFGAALMAKHAAQIFKEQNYGNIINIGSTAALRGYEGGTVYASSKFALRGMTECWRTELRIYNIRVILINPSEVTSAFGSETRTEREEEPKKLRSKDIAHVIKSVLEMDDRGFIPELQVWATNPF